MLKIGDQVAYYPTNWVTGALRRDTHYFGQPARIVDLKGKLAWLMFEDKTVSYAKITEIKKRVVKDGGTESAIKENTV